jgi:exodeoxyribonuclease VII large subunit
LVEGEISNCRPSSTGHLYFTLKDERAAVSCVMWRSSLRRLAFVPKDGATVRVKGSISVYPPRGGYQIVFQRIDLTGEGDILAMLEERKRKLADEGLFDKARKKLIPRFPDVVGVVSSPTGAALRDTLNILRRRAPGVRVLVLPAPVQGNEAAPVIARRIKEANQFHLCDTLIVGRGGGSLEDLLPFSDEEVVRAVAASDIPVISAVGHEIDWALSDFAADLRAPTPSAAAELASADYYETSRDLRARERAIEDAMESRVEHYRLALTPFSAGTLELRFRSLLQPRLLRFDDAKEVLVAACKERLQTARSRLALAKTSVEAANPLAALERGFSVVSRVDTGAVVRSPSDAPSGTRLKVRPKEGEFFVVSE